MARIKIQNSKAERKKQEIDNQVSIEGINDILSKRAKFNFHYFTHQPPHGTHFCDWSQKELAELLDKLKNYCEMDLYSWTNRPIGGGKHRKNVLEIYDTFPSNSAFSEPKHIPIEAKWARFRLEGDKRLIGFVLPHEYHDKAHSKTTYRFDKNTFYVVFLDKEHNFYK
jgi:hypothetical protein